MTSHKTLGVDISKKKFDVALLCNGKLKNKRFTNDPKGFDLLLQWLTQHEGLEAHVCLEATGIYGEALSEHLYDSGLKISVVNPARIKGFAQSELLRNKTDKTDAGLIARFCHAMQPQLWSPLPKEIRQLRDWVRHLEALQGMRQQEKNRIEAASEVIKEHLIRHIDYLDTEIKQIKSLINQHIESHPSLEHRKNLLTTIPGIGEATIGVILSEFGDIARFKNAKALSAYIGVAPRIRESGSSLKGRSTMSKTGRSQLRKAFFMPALVALRYNPIIVELKERLTKAGKSKMAIVGAAMRKLVHLIYGVLKNGVPFDEKFA
ncbi:MAG: transposase [Pseudomonadales bacterium]|nr:transposase [Pseudomonadales bacterium]